MDILQIILIGVLFNFASLTFISVFLIIETLINIKNPNYMKIVMESQNLTTAIKELKLNLRAKNKRTFTQRSFILFLPFGYGLILLKMLYYFKYYTLLEQICYIIESDKTVLEERLKSI